MEPTDESNEPGSGTTPRKRLQDFSAEDMLQEGEEVQGGFLQFTLTNDEMRED